MWYLLCGPDAVTRDERAQALCVAHSLADSNAATLNIISLGAEAEFGELERACESAGFFAEKRLVIARHWLSKAFIGRKRSKVDEAHIEKLVAFLPMLDELTDLVFIEDDALPATHPLIKFAASTGKKHIENFPVPDSIEPWIVRRAASKGGKISPAAAQRLATRIHRGNKLDRDHFVEDTRLYLRKLETELDKLTAYARGRQIEPADVDVLTAEEEVADIFKFVDMIGQNRNGEAYTVARGVLARGESPLVLLIMLGNHYRLLIQAAENLRSAPESLAEKLGLHPFPVKKALEQARRASLPALEESLRAILRADEAIKTGAMEDVVALDVLIAELAV